MSNDKWLKGVTYNNNLSPKDIEIKKLKDRISKAIDQYENCYKTKYKKQRFIEGKSIADMMYEILKGEDNEL